MSTHASVVLICIIKSYVKGEMVSRRDGARGTLEPRYATPVCDLLRIHTYDGNGTSGNAVAPVLLLHVDCWPTSFGSKPRSSRPTRRYSIDGIKLRTSARSCACLLFLLVASKDQSAPTGDTRPRTTPRHHPCMARAIPGLSSCSLTFYPLNPL